MTKAEILNEQDAVSCLMAPWKLVGVFFIHSTSYHLTIFMALGSVQSISCAFHSCAKMPPSVLCFYMHVTNVGQAPVYVGARCGLLLTAIF